MCDGCTPLTPSRQHTEAFAPDLIAKVHLVRPGENHLFPHRLLCAADVNFVIDQHVAPHESLVAGDDQSLLELGPEDGTNPNHLLGRIQWLVGEGACAQLHVEAAPHHL
eukprot:5847619-Prymnesium_polylepis.1